MRRPCIFWNVQRLFDPAGLPVARALGAAHEWTRASYRRKLANLAACLRALTGGQAPAILALAEIESLRAQRDLRASLGWDELASIDELAPDPSLDGLDVAMLVDRTIFDVSSVRARSIALDNRFSTRDLLDVRLRLHGSGAEVVLVALHWPSRLIAEGRSLRLAYSVYLQRLLRSVLKLSKADLVTADGEVAMPPRDALLERWNTPCIVMGDFNDEPHDPSVREGLGSTRFAERVVRHGRLVGKAVIEPAAYLDKKLLLYNPCWDLRFSDDGSLGGTYYRSEWRAYDQVLLTHGALQPGSPARYVDGSVSVARLPEALGRASKRVEMATSHGVPRKFDPRDRCGVSDHFPLSFMMDFEV